LEQDILQADAFLSPNQQCK